MPAAWMSVSERQSMSTAPDTVASNASSLDVAPLGHALGVFNPVGHAVAP